MSGFEFLGDSIVLQHSLPKAIVLAVGAIVIAKVWWESAFNEPAEDLYYIPPVRRLSEQSEVEFEEQPEDDLSITSLSMAAEKGNVLAAMRILAEGADINLADTQGRTPLHRAVQARQVAIVELFLRQPGIQLEVRQKEKNYTAYELALWRLECASIQFDLARATASGQKKLDCISIVRKIRLAMLRAEEVQVVAAVTAEIAPVIAIASEQQPLSRDITAVTLDADRKKVRFQ